MDIQFIPKHIPDRVSHAASYWLFCCVLFIVMGYCLLVLYWLDPSACGDFYNQICVGTSLFYSS
jgi:hypothetical protein